ncbi:MAG: FAD-dependent oxidoreductase [Beijerinckiaceae bacterium]|nr:FAD-dependent oxidoreductase [Beijerinckiaceae bacterium]
MNRMITRRGATFGLAAAAAFPNVLRAQTTFDVDVVVVGAGAAGIGAGQELRALGKRAIVLEARGRVGGRVFTDRSLGDPWDAGALYIHWSETNPFTKLAERLGFETLDPSSTSGGMRFVDFSASGDAPQRRGGFGIVQDLFDTDIAPVPDISILDRVGGPKADVAQAAMAIARMSLGDEPERISALDYARLWAGDDLVVRQGYGTLVEKAAEGLDIRLSSPVEAIDWSGAGVRVTTKNGVINARAAIVTLPVGVLQKGGVRFTPELPQTTRDGLAGLGMGALTKVALKFNGERFGLPAGMDIWERLGPRRSFNFECFTYDRDVVIAFFGGDHAREVMAQGEQGAVRVVLDEFKRMVGARVEKAFVGGKLAGWANDPFSMGAYSHALPGRANARALLAAPVGDRIWFAGEATAGTGPEENFGGAMTAGGAWIAGVAAARKIALLG